MQTRYVGSFYFAWTPVCILFPLFGPKSKVAGAEELSGRGDGAWEQIILLQEKTFVSKWFSDQFANFGSGIGISEFCHPRTKYFKYEISQNCLTHFKNSSISNLGSKPQHCCNTSQMRGMFSEVAKSIREMQSALAEAKPEGVQRSSVW